MACRKGLLREEERYRNGPASAVAGDALLFITMCIIGLPVDAHAKDGSIYSGIFHTASVDNDYAIVLKKARMIKKGNQETNIVNGSLIETLIIHSEDLVQVVAKEILLPPSGIGGNVGGDSIEAIRGYSGCLDRDTKEKKANEVKSLKKHKSQIRILAKRDNEVTCMATSNTTNMLGASSEEHNGRSDAAELVKIEESQNTVLLERQVGNDGSQEIESTSQNCLELEAERTADDQGSNLSSATHESHLNDLDETNAQQTPKTLSSGSGLENHCRMNSEKTKCPVASPPKVSCSDIHKGSLLNASSNSFVPLDSSSLNKYPKESKLNPGAKVFAPSMLHHKLMSPPAMPSGGTVSYMPETYTMGPIANAQPEVDANSLVYSSTPAKFVSYNNIPNGNGGNDSPYFQPIIGQLVNRTQPVRYSGQYQNFQTGAAYVHPNPQNVMLGRVGPLVCMHPISNNAVQSVTGISPATTRPLLTPHQVYLPKHQGNASAQALQLCMTAPIITNGPQQFMMPSSIAVSPSLYPVIRPIAVPGTNGFLASKFA